MDACSIGNATIKTNQTLLEEINHSRARQYSPVIVYLVLLMVIGVFGNSLIIYTYGTRFKRTTTTYFVLWLAVLDLLSCTFGLPFEIADVLHNTNFTAVAACKIARFATTVIILMSALCLLVVALDRYFKVCKPHRRPPFSSLKQLVGLTVVIAGLLSWPTLFTFGIEDIFVSVPSETFVITGSICSTDGNTSIAFIRVYWVVIGLIFVGACVFMVTMYTLLVYSLHKIEAQMAMRANRNSGVSDKTRTGRTTRLFVGITIVFILSFLPMLALFVLETLSKFCDQTLATDIVIKIFIRSQYINNVANPFLYGFYNQLFRRECKAIFFRRLVRFGFTRYSVEKRNSIEHQSSVVRNSEYKARPSVRVKGLS